MISLQHIVEKNTEVWEKANVLLRDVQLPEGRDIKAIVGPRRAGKTYFLYQLAKEFEKEKNVIYLSFDDIMVKYRGVEEFWTFFTSLEKNTVLLLDEIQELENWGRWLRKLHDLEKFEIIVSGSSSHLLTKEVASELRGRYIAKLFLPLSFREYVRFKEKGWNVKSFLSYIKEGGFPEVVLFKGKKEKLESIFLTTFYRDLIDRYRLREEDLAEELIKELISSTGSLMTLGRLYRKFHSFIPISKKTIWKYVKNMEESFIIFTSKAHTFSAHKTRILPFKVYANDIGIAQLFKQIPIGMALETIVAHEILRSGHSLSYLPLKSGEVDFIVDDKVCIEVTYGPDDEHITKLKNTNCEEAHLLTLEDQSLLKFLHNPADYLFPKSSLGNTI